MKIDLSGHVCVVTGASGELGRVISRTLGGAGAAVALHFYKGEERAAGLLEELRSQGVTAMAVQADVTEMASVEAMRDAVNVEIGPADIIVGNAVVQYDWVPVLDQPLSDFESQFRSCVLHNVHLVKAFAPAMAASGWGRVIGINTECAMQCHETQAAYASAKRGMDGLYRVLARELGPNGITVNQVAPGWMISDAHRVAGTEKQPDYEATVPLRRRGVDQDVANAVAFLASDLAGFITGAFIPVCGGNVMPAI
ncbi:MAG: SDR family oxidoreductase [Thermoanaerobaculales bacterium]|nr:SDR family oxidoreductase [Thermoanaerobaculales bacterium]